jgi:hypothetical protein
MPICNAEERTVIDYTEEAGPGLRLVVLYKRAMFHTKRLARGESDTMSLRSSRATASVGVAGEQPRELGLRPGDWVEVLSEQEIRSTLDDRERHKGLYFMPEMRKYCGQTLRVRKKVENIMLESNREMRRVRIPTVILEDAVCDGESSGGCDRSCFLLWREKWLKRAAQPGERS